jgi:hypothetical protein
MKKDQVRTGGVYIAKVSGNLVKVRIIGERAFKNGWTAENLETGRLIHVKSAQRLREEVTS